MKTLQSSYTVPGLFVLLLSAVLLSLASCGGGGGGGGSNGGGSPAITVSAISAGDSHTCAILSTGAAKCWGENFNGQLGDDSTDDSNLPAAVVQTPADTSDTDSDKHTSAVLLDSGVTAISAGLVHTCAIHNGAAKCWGFNGNGRLGDGFTDDSPIPVQVSGLTSQVTAISAGGAHTCAIHNTAGEGETEALAAKCWGLNGNGQLGDGSSTKRLTPVQVSGLGNGVIDISAGEVHTCAIHRTTAGKHAAKCWGSNNKGQLGNGATSGEQNAPVPVGGELGDLVTDISAGNAHTCAIQDGKAWCWGDNSLGQLGRVLGVSLMVSGTPEAVVDPTSDGRDQLSGVTDISAGSGHTCALLASGVVHCWGLNSNGQLGVDTTSTASSTIPLQVEGLESQVTAISAGDEHTCALLDSGVVQCWGSNGDGQLGVGTLSGDATSSPTPQALSFE